MNQTIYNNEFWRGLPGLKVPQANLHLTFLETHLEMISKAPHLTPTINTTEELVGLYSDFMVINREVFRDLAKKAKNEVEYYQLVGAEHTRLIWLANTMRHVLTVVRAKGNKKLILRLIGQLEGVAEDMQYVTGGGARPDTKRLILIYEREGGIITKKRNAKTPFANAGGHHPVLVGNMQKVPAVHFAAADAVSDAVADDAALEHKSICFALYRWVDDTMWHPAPSIDFDFPR